MSVYSVQLFALRFFFWLYYLRHFFVFIIFSCLERKPFLIKIFLGSCPGKKEQFFSVDKNHKFHVWCFVLLDYEINMHIYIFGS